MTRTAVGLELVLIISVPLVGLVAHVNRMWTNVVNEMEAVNRRASTPMEVIYVNVGVDLTYMITRRIVLT
jgi:hypothetical protein